MFLVPYGSNNRGIPGSSELPVGQPAIGQLAAMKCRLAIMRCGLSSHEKNAKSELRHDPMLVHYPTLGQHVHRPLDPNISISAPD